MDRTNNRPIDEDSDESLEQSEHARHSSDSHSDTDPANADEPNPARTTTGKFTVPKFGSAGSGGAELEPGPERD